MKRFQFLYLLLPLFLAACGLTPQEQADYASVHRAGVSPAIYDKMLHGDDLSISDIESLGRAHVNSGVILRYIRDQNSVYLLRTADVTALQKADVDPSVVDYMLQTGRQNYGPNPYSYGYGYGYPYGYGYGFDPFWYPGYYGGFSYYGRGYGYYRGGGGGYHH